MMQIFAAWLAVCCLSFACAEYKSYTGYELLEVLTPTDEDIETVRMLKQTDNSLDFWYESPESAHIFISPSSLGDAKNYLDFHGIEFRVINDHIQRDIEQEQQRMALRRKQRKEQGIHAYDYDDYGTAEEITEEVQDIALRCHPSLHCEIFNMGETTEKNRMEQLHIYKNLPFRRAVWIDAGIHGRDWLAIAVGMKIMSHFVDDYLQDTIVTNLLDQYDVYIMPMLNTDGYNFTWYYDRMWKKNRYVTNAQCTGIDLARNFNENWGWDNSSTDPCSPEYCGRLPASEVETQHIQDDAFRIRFDLFTSVHIESYGQQWIFPYSHTVNGTGLPCRYATDHDEMFTVAQAAANASEHTHRTTWFSGNACKTRYAASGVQMDYMKDMRVFNDSNTVYTRGASYVETNSQIQPAFEEVWNGMVAAIYTLASIPNGAF